MSNQIANYVKETFVVKFMKVILGVLLFSVIANAFFLGRHVTFEKQIAENQQVITAIAIENNKLKVERDQAVANYMHTKAKLDTALIPEATFKEAANVHVVQPTKEVAINAYTTTRESLATAGDFVKMHAVKAWSYVQ
jgi:hypothetical protein